MRRLYKPVRNTNKHRSLKKNNIYIYEFVYTIYFHQIYQHFKQVQKKISQRVYNYVNSFICDLKSDKLGSDIFLRK